VITVTVRYLAGFSAAAGKTSEVFRLPEGATVGSLIESLKKRHSREFRALLARDEAYRNVLFLRRGAAIGPKVQIEHGDEIIVSLPVGGG
jgi:MoaD family protein